jgi:hypothetical protein
MLSKMLSDDDHRYISPRPRPAMNVDVCRVLVGVEDPHSIRMIIDQIAKDNGGGLARIKNGFALSDAEANATFHLRVLLANLVFTSSRWKNYGDLMGDAQVQEKWDQYHLYSEPDGQPGGRWREDIARALRWFRGGLVASRLGAAGGKKEMKQMKKEMKKEMKKGGKEGEWEEGGKDGGSVEAFCPLDAPVRMVCEVQMTLRSSVAVRHLMHEPYKYVRAPTAAHLYEDCKRQGRKQRLLLKTWRVAQYIATTTSSSSSSSSSVSSCLRLLEVACAVGDTIKVQKLLSVLKDEKTGNDGEQKVEKEKKVGKGKEKETAGAKTETIVDEMAEAEAEAEAEATAFVNSSLSLLVGSPVDISQKGESFRI